jgi:hypothetical protein
MELISCFFAADEALGLRRTSTLVEGCAADVRPSRPNFSPFDGAFMRLIRRVFGAMYK